MQIFRQYIDKARGGGKLDDTEPATRLGKEFQLENCIKCITMGCI